MSEATPEPPAAPQENLGTAASSAGEQVPSKPPFWQKPGCLWLTICGGGLLFLECAGLPLLSLLVGLVAILTLGWAWFLYHTLPQVSVSWGDVILGVVVLGLMFGTSHRLARRFVRQRNRPAPRFGTTVRGVLLVVLMFAAGTAMVAGVHQLAWLATSEEPLLRYSSIRGVARRMQSMNNLKNVGLGVHDLAGQDGILPASTVDEWGRPLHSWITMLLPYIDCEAPYIDCAALYRQIDLTRPWDAPENRDNFAYKVRYLQHPAFWKSQRNAEGLALTSYAANGRVIGLGWRFSPDDISDGEASTILLGEVASQPPAWGDPLNFRDPALGLQGGPKTFGSPSGEAVNMQFADGHVVGLNPDIDPRVLKAISTPNGGEQVGASDFE